MLLGRAVPMLRVMHDVKKLQLLSGKGRNSLHGDEHSDSHLTQTDLETQEKAETLLSNSSSLYQQTILIQDL
jgi:hypothetical protein